MSQPTSANRPTGFERGRGFNGPTKKAKNQKQTLLRIWSYLRIQRVELISVVVFVIISTLATSMVWHTFLLIVRLMVWCWILL